MKVSLRGLRTRRNLPRATGRGLPQPAVVATGTPRLASSRRTAQRMRVYLKQTGHCAVCGVLMSATEYELDHIMPLHLGGGVEDSNVAALCRECHHQKSAREATERARKRGARDGQ